MSRHGDFIKEQREKRGLTQAEISKRAGISVQYLSNIERDVSGLCPKYFTNICKVFKISPSKLEEIYLKDYIDKQREKIRSYR